MENHKRYEVDLDGLHVRTAGGELVHICSPLHRVGYVTDADGSRPAHLLEIETLTDRKRVELPEAALVRRSELTIKLIEYGVRLEENIDSVEHIRTYLKSFPPHPLFKRVAAEGWMHPNGSGGFVFRKTLYDAAGTTRVIRPIGQQKKFQRRGDINRWRAVSQMLEANPLPLSALCFALAAPILRPLGQSSFCVSFVGGTSSGKSTLLRLAQSLLTTPGELATWSGTANGLIARAVEHNDLPFIVDEIGQAIPSDLYQLIYDLTSGLEKLRANPDGGATVSASVSTVVISAGEISVFDRMSLARQRSTGGHYARFITLSVEGEQGIVSDLRGSPSSRIYVKNLNSILRETHGVAWPRYVRYIAGTVAKIKKDYFRLADQIREGLTDDLPFDESDNIASRVLDHFAISTFAGFLAVEAEIVDLSKRAIGRAMHTCFANWLAGYSRTQAQSQSKIIEEIKAFLRERQDRIVAFVEYENRESREPLGYRHTSKSGGSLLLIRPSALNDLKEKFGPRIFHESLRNSGWLISGPGNRPTAQFKIPGGGGDKFNAYALHESILEGT